jgi:hypothetical protein
LGRSDSGFELSRSSLPKVRAWPEIAATNWKLAHLNRACVDFTCWRALNILMRRTNIISSR